MTDLSRLRELAEKATPGPWFVHQEWDEADIGTIEGNPYDGRITDGPEGSRAMSATNADYIAAVSPDVLLSLLDRLERAEDPRRAEWEAVQQIKADLRAGGLVK